ncbi:MAG: hypothetical protein M3Y46_05515 [Actinomycetota bacterium]|nr:hypothetical protein [Actinomycetota bacterium]
MKVSKLAPVIVCALAAALTLTACSAPAPSAGDGPSTVCDGSIFSDSIDAQLEVTATGLQEPAFPIDELLASGLDVRCSARFAVDYVEAGRTVEFDVLVSADGIEPTSAAIDRVVTAQDWAKDEKFAIWRDPADPTHYVQALETPRGVLVGTTDAG